MLKKLYYFIAGNPSIYSFEHRIFNITCFTGTLFTTLGFALNFSLGLDWVVTAASITGILYGIIQYYFSRISGLFYSFFVELYVVVTNVLLGVSFFYNDGSAGTVFYMLLVNFFVFMLIGKQSQQLRISIVFLFTTLLLITLEIRYPEWLTGYENETQRIFDHATLLIYSLLFTGLIVRLFRKDYDNEKEIIEQQREELSTLYQKTSEKNTYIETLIRELHHRTKNNLQVVSSLLALQSKRLHDENARMALEDGRTRVEAMALIHQKLFLNEELASVDMKNYIENLSLSLAESFGFRPANVKTSIALPGYTLDIDRAVPLGLMVNELVTNAFKHAFKGVATPLVEISLQQKEHLLELTVADNGTGMNNMPDEQTSFGMKLLHTLAEQLEANVEASHQKGTTFRITFPV